MSETAQLLAQIKAQLDTNTEATKKIADQAIEEAKNAGELSLETRNKTDEVLAKNSELFGKYEDLKAQVGEMEAANDEMAQKIANFKGRGAPSRPKSLGEIVVNSDEYKNASKGFGTIEIDVQNAITTDDASAGVFVEPELDPELVRLPQKELTIMDLISQGSTSSDVVKFLKQTVRTNNAGMVAQGALKPESDYKWAKDEVNVRKIAHWVHVSEELIQDAGVVMTEINTELKYGLQEKKEAQILAGDGTGENLSGLMTKATAFTAALGTGVADAQPLDVLRVSMLQVRLEHYNATGIVLNPTDWMKLELLKDGNKQYLHANPRYMTQPTLWGIPVIQTASVGAGQFLVGDFKRAATLYNRMSPVVRMSSEDRDNFVKNMYTILAELRLALAVKRPLALVKGTLATALPAS